MAESFDRAPGAERTRGKAGCPPGVRDAYPGRQGEEDPGASVFNQCEPLRQPRTSPPTTNTTTCPDRNSSKPSNPANSNNDSSSSTAALKPHSADPVVQNSTLSVSAPEFFPSTYAPYQDAVYEDGADGYYAEPSLADLVQEFLSHLSSSPGSFEFEIEYITATLNSWVTSEETLHELVELIFTQSTSMQNFAYTGARLCNHLSHHISLSPSTGNFRQLLLQRCRTEFQQRDQAVVGDDVTQRRFHSYVFFLGELYLNLEVKSGKGPPTRADILQMALKQLMDTLFSNPADANLICAVKLLKLTGSILEDSWKQSGKPHMEEIFQRIRNVLLDVQCKRDVKQMLLQLVELRSSNWGRVYTAAAVSEATPDNDPNYYMVPNQIQHLTRYTLLLMSPPSTLQMELHSQLQIQSTLRSIRRYWSGRSVSPSCTRRTGMIRQMQTRMRWTRRSRKRSRSSARSRRGDGNRSNSRSELLEPPGTFQESSGTFQESSGNV
ncbi:polyadenylate-binding protein-interacting protein 1 isoform X4 [Astyanax mexicanus]|uniref:polyadenylate-binding protein-interacting protein 1 isoform X2 n=1 Tax=Astyanax mexicanus TaxID=7994 RepID=UPI0020CB5134|nr:polyadenylate-binding protein-interacting protein 1 isoform X2 [Astyanax mexicanus]XP_049326670.1 polyadenylate-binding protein-interacting protein 1 isoform X3 [Astyanax mexicanus]XP_049326671.1 polyadenylate-binding protein-interacting protein 1 isoform X4 [Astyanax mexicanus]